jgi:hypothetical protein
VKNSGELAAFGRMLSFAAAVMSSMRPVIIWIIFGRIFIVISILLMVFDDFSLAYLVLV